MSVSSEINRVSYNGDASTLIYDVPFYFIKDADIKVYVNGAIQVLNTNYTVTGAGEDSGGQITFLVAPSAALGNVIVLRDPDQLQSIQIPTNDKFPSTTVVRGFDKLTMLVQRARDLASRSFTLGDSDASGVSLTIPTPAANRALVWNASGTALGNSSEDIDASAVAAAEAAAAAAVQTALALAATTAAEAAAASANLAKINWRGDWDSGEAYAQNDAVQNNGSSYLAHTANTNQEPPNVSFWDVLAQKGAAGAGFGDMVTTENLADLANKATARSNLAVPGLATANTFAAQQSVPNDPFDSGWEDNDEVPTKEDLYDILNNQLTIFTTAGTSPNFTVTPDTEGTYYVFKAHAAGSTGSNTLNDGSGSKPLKQYGQGGALVDGVVNNGQIIEVREDGANWVILNPSAASSALYVQALPKDLDAEHLYSKFCVLMSNGLIASWGRGDYYALGRGRVDGITIKPAFASFSPSIPQGVSVVDFTADGNINYAVLSNGWVYSCGNNATYGALGHGDTTDRTVYTRVEYFVTNTITAVKAWVFTSRVTPNAATAFVLDDNGDVYSCGYANVGRHGQGDTATKTNFALVTGSIPPIVDVVACAASYYSHVMLLDEDGDLWAAGYNGNGELGLADTANRTIFTGLTSLPNPVTKVCVSSGFNATTGAAFAGHTMALTSNGDVYAWGYNGYGQLGHGDTSSRTAPVKITALSNIVDIGAHGGLYGYSWAIDSDGKLYTWGYNNHGALGQGTTSNISTPTLVARWSGGVETPPFEGIISKVVGRSGVGYNELLLLDTDGNIYFAGYQSGAILLETATSITSFTPVTPFQLNSPGEKIVDIIFCGYDGYSNYMALSDAGILYAAGYNQYGQLTGDTSAHTYAIPALTPLPLKELS